MKPNTYTIEVETKDGNRHQWRFCKGAKIASWKSEAKAEAYAERLRKANPESKFRVTFWPDVFVI